MTSNPIEKIPGIDCDSGQAACIRAVLQMIRFNVLFGSINLPEENRSNQVWTRVVDVS